MKYGVGACKSLILREWSMVPDPLVYFQSGFCTMKSPRTSDWWAESLLEWTWEMDTNSFATLQEGTGCSNSHSSLSSSHRELTQVVGTLDFILLWLSLMAIFKQSIITTVTRGKNPVIRANMVTAQTACINAMTILGRHIKLNELC